MVLSRCAWLLMAASSGSAGFVTAAADAADPVQAWTDAGPSGNDNGQRHACTGAVAGSQAVICVRAGAAGGGTGTAAMPLATVMAAVSAAKAGDIVQVAAGNYGERVVLGAFNSPVGKDLTLLGGFSADFATRDAGVHASILDGGQLGPTVQLHLDGGQVTTLDGFRITGGRGLGSSWQDGYGHGGGIHAEQLGSGQIVISHNRIHGNRSNNHDSADSRGGGIHAATPNWGGSTASIRIAHNRIVDNRAGKGAGINVSGRHALIEHNLVEDNTGHHDHGGGVYVSTADTQIRGNIIRGNVIGATVGYGWGGGILIAAAGADMDGNVVTDNYTPTTGSGVFWDEGASGTMKNDLIYRNRCPNGARSGAALYVDGGPGGPSTVAIENITIADHLCPATPDGAAVVVEDGSSISVRNAILWGNSREVLTLSGGSVTIAYSITGQAGPGNALVDPLFADAGAGDYHVRSAAGRYTPTGWVNDALSSPAIDAGDPASPYALEPSPNGGRVNLGAYGNTAQASRSAGGDVIFANGFQLP